MKEELGNSWLEPHLFRFGASSMLGDIERQLEFHATAVIPRSIATRSRDTGGHGLAVPNGADFFGALAPEG